MPAMKYLVVNADDFGQSEGVNAGIVEAHRHGVVTSTSLMVRWPAAREAPERSRTSPGLGFGLHVDLEEWAYRNGEWVRLYDVVADRSPAAIEAEVRRQLATFRALLRREPTHLDSHQHAHRDEPTRSVVATIGRELGVPVRHLTPWVRYLGAFYGQTADGQHLPGAVTAEALAALIAGVGDGVTELACHPAADVEELDTMYRSERIDELRALCDARVRAAVRDAGVTLCSFSEVVAVVGVDGVGVGGRA